MVYSTLCWKNKTKVRVKYILEKDIQKKILKHVQIILCGKNVEYGIEYLGVYRH